MASAGERTSFCEFLTRPPISGSGEISGDVASWTVWARAWGKKRGVSGREAMIAGESQALPLEEFYFDYADVIDPAGDGKRLDETMVIRVDDGTAAGALYDIGAVHPDEVSRREVRVMATRKRNPV